MNYLHIFNSISILIVKNRCNCLFVYRSLTATLQRDSRHSCGWSLGHKLVLYKKCKNIALFHSGSRGPTRLGHLQLKRCAQLLSVALPIYFGISFASHKSAFFILIFLLTQTIVLNMYLDVCDGCHQCYFGTNEVHIGCEFFFSITYY